jgi:hypothetical protein
MAALDASGVFEHLRAFDPVLAGTVPLDIDTDESDLDVLCCASQLDVFAAVLIRTYRHAPSFEMRRGHVRDRPTVTARFRALTFPVEIFCETCAVELQYGFRHMFVEQRLLQIGGAALRDAIRQLKREGLKTEPAFAQILNLPGDPYEALLGLENAPNDDLRRMLGAA